MKLFLTTLLCTASLFAAVDLNNATAKELQSVKGIGTKKAAQIIAYREKKCFQSVEELANIKGIGQKTIKKLEPFFEVGPCPKR
ncbi:ComEA family DNA-binding protein [Hydrogenimonas sp.]